jgi:hypothetical protein
MVEKRSGFKVHQAPYERQHTLIKKTRHVQQQNAIFMKNRCKKLLLLLLLEGITPAMMAQYGFGTTTPDSHAAVDITSTTKGFLPPRMTTAQLKAFTDANPTPEGYIVFDTDRHCLAYYVNKSFTCFPVVSSTANAPTVTVTTPTVSGTTLSFTKTYSLANTLPEGNSVIKWYTAGSSSGAGSQVVVGASALSYTLPSSSCGAFVCASYTPVASNGEVGAEVFTSWVVVGGSITINHRVAGGVAAVDGPITYKTQLLGVVGSEKCWILQNLGAVDQPLTLIDVRASCAGWFFQFNRLRGYYANSGPLPRDGWAATINEPTDWAHDNDPCRASLGDGWHVPSWSEIDDGFGFVEGATPAVCYASLLKLHYVGMMVSDGKYYPYPDAATTYWWSSQSTSGTAGCARAMSNAFGWSSNMNFPKTYGNPVRCVRD